MIVFNKKDNVFFYIHEDKGYVGKTYSIFKIKETNCIESSPIISGEIPLDLKITLKIPDGKYQISIEGENEVPDIQENFIVFYNDLPYILKKLQRVFCKCNNCEELNIKLLHEIFFDTITYANCLGLDDEMKLVNNLSCKLHAKLKLETTQESLYAKKRSKDSYIDKIKQYLLYFYTELYLKHSQSLKEENQDIKDIDQLFNIDVFKNCMFDSGYDFEEIVRKYNSINCGCDE